MINFNAPTEVVREMVNYIVSPYIWKILKDGPDNFLVEEKMIGDKPFNRSTYIGPAQIEVCIVQASVGTDVVCDGQNEYYGDDPPPKSGHDFLNGHMRTQSDLSVKIAVIKLGLDKKFKEWSAQQRYHRIQEEKRLPQQPSRPPRPQAAPVSTPTNGPPIIPVALKQEQMSVEDFVAKLERLAALQRSGALTNAEFERAKLLLLKATE